MDWFELHEIFEMEVLERLKSARLLEKLIFGGGTMLRLCHELPRYSVDLDFWKLRPVDDTLFLQQLKQSLESEYEITDSQLKRNTILIEFRSPRYPRRLKIEIRREIREWDIEEQIAFSPYSTRQVLLIAHTLPQTLQNKIAALLDRGAIRDAFDIEFILRRGVKLPPLKPEVVEQLLSRLRGFSAREFQVTLGSVLQPEWREYYRKNGFRWLEEKLQGWKLNPDSKN